jgi:hypothetical protein
MAFHKVPGLWVTEKEKHMARIDITVILAVWGAVVSTTLAAIQAQQYFHGRRPHVQVSFHPNVITPIFGDWAECCEIHAVNVGSKPVTIEALALQLSDETTFNPARLECYTRRDLPATLTESEAISAFLKRDEVPMEKVMWAFARGTDRRIYKSERFKLS